MLAVGRAAALVVAVSLAFLATGPFDAVAAKRITGKLSKPGYTVIALAADGRAKSVVARRGRFRLKPKSERITLHLRAPDGVYAGPVVVRAQGRRAVLGVKAGATLGRVAVRRRFARPVRRLAGRWVDDTRTARARRGVPIGAGRFGRVRSKPGGSVPGDRDRDGIPGPLDVDDDGDLVLDNLDRSGAASAAQIQNEFVIASGLDAGLGDTANANATDLTTADADALLSSRGTLKVRFVLGGTEELDCRGLIYCSLGGTGRLHTGGPSIRDYPRYPECCDPDGDGFGTLEPRPDVSDAMVLVHGATTAQIGTGDVLIERVTTNGVEIQYPTTVPYVFATVPALLSYDDGRGNSRTVSYPHTPSPELADGFPVAAGPNGDVVVQLTFWRPQRTPIPPEPGEWIDIGGLGYAVWVPGSDVPCPKRALSEDDPNLMRVGVEALPGQEGGSLVDLSADQPANPANTFTYTVNLTECLSAAGSSFEPGESRTFAFEGSTEGEGKSSGSTSQTVSFKRE